MMKQMASIALLSPGALVFANTPALADEEPMKTEKETGKEYLPYISQRDMFSNGNAIFKEDYYFKYGVLPKRRVQEMNEFMNSINESPLPFVKISTRYDLYKKYGPRIIKAQVALQELGKAIDGKDWEEVQKLIEAKRIESGLRPMGIFSTAVLSPDVTVTKEALLLRYYVGEIQFGLQGVIDGLAAKDPSYADGAYRAAKDSYNSWAFLINKQITPKVGSKFEML